MACVVFKRCGPKPMKNIMQINRKKAIVLLCSLVFCLIISIITQCMQIKLNIYCYNNYYERIGSQEIFSTHYSISKTQFDATAKYKTAFYVVTATDWIVLSKCPLCIALHTSLDRLHYMTEFMKTWTGPISVAIFTPGVEQSLALHYINYLTSCYPNIRSQVSFHMTVLADDKKADDIQIDTSSWSCEDHPVDVLKNLLSLRSNEDVEKRKPIMFPGNLLRNIARDTCQSPWLMNLDIDMVLPRPTPDIQPSFTDQLLEYLTSYTAEKCTKCAFVLPIFEVRSNVTQLPSNKTELIDLFNKKLARTFYFTFFIASHAPSEQTTRWIMMHRNKHVYVAYQANYKFKYEPLYVTKRGSPAFDERYLQRGMDRDSQAYEMYLDGYTFLIMDNIFLCHLGYKLPEQIRDPFRPMTWINERIFEKHGHRELAAKYDKDPLNLLETYKKKHHHNFTIKMNL